MLDTATLEINGQGSTTGSSTRVYDVNGQLQEAIDSQVDNKGQNNTTRYRSSSLAKSREYKKIPDWNWERLQRAHPNGVENDDFAFYKYK